MIWQEFLDTLQAFKKSKNKLHVDSGTVVNLLYSGSLNSVIGYDPKWQEMLAKSVEIREAMNSEAQPQKAKKHELFGIIDIDSDLKLNLWRHQVNPLTTFYITVHFETALQHFGVHKTVNDQVLFENGQYHVWRSWRDLLDAPYLPFYLQRVPPQLPVFVGMVEGVSASYTKNGKEMLSFDFFTGQDYIERIKVWAEKDGKVHDQLKKAIKAKAYGIAVLKVQEYNESITASLVQWTSIYC